MDFLAEFTQHIPPEAAAKLATTRPFPHLIRYYGYYQHATVLRQEDDRHGRTVEQPIIVGRQVLDWLHDPTWQESAALNNNRA